MKFTTFLDGFILLCIGYELLSQILCIPLVNFGESVAIAFINAIRAVGELGSCLVRRQRFMLNVASDVHSVWIRIVLIAFLTIIGQL